LVRSDRRFDADQLVDPVRAVAVDIGAAVENVSCAVVTVQGVVPPLAAERVAAGAADEDVVAVAGLDGVIAGTAGDDVVAAVPAQRVVVAAAVEEVAAFVPVDDVGAVAAD
jgi:hypothetical protein